MFTMIWKEKMSLSMKKGVFGEYVNSKYSRSASKSIYSRTSLSRTRLIRITAYLEVKIWSRFYHEIMTTEQNNVEKRSNSSFPHYFTYIILTSGVKLHIHLLNVVVQFIVFLTLSSLICRGTDISKCFSESLGIRDNGSRLYL